MKCYPRYCCVLLCFVLLFGVFSIIVSAEEFSNLEMTVGFTDYPPAYTFENGSTFVHNVQSQFIPNPSTILKPYLNIKSVDGTLLLKANSKATITVNSLRFAFFGTSRYDSSNTIYEEFTNLESCNLVVVYTDGTYDGVPAQFAVGRNNYITFTVDFEASKDVELLQLVATYNLYSQSGTSVGLYDITNLQIVGNVSGVEVDVESQEVGLLTGILNWIENIFDSISELPSKIWAFIESGLQSLFVPSEEGIVEFKDKIDMLLTQKLGAVYQVIDVMFDSWDRITASEETNTIEFPIATIDLPNNNSFTFGGYSVPIVPVGFEFIVTILKGFIAIICTIVFVDGLRKRYDEVMGVEK